MQRVDRKTWRLGVAANLSPGSSVHRDSFIYGIKYGLRDHRGQLSIDVLTGDDKATSGGGLAVAKRFVADGVDLVIGHFSSAAAAAAAPIYQEAGIPLLLPAATRVDLATYSTTYRLCGNDFQLAHAMAEDIRNQFEIDTLHIETDGSDHANIMKQYVTDAFKGYDGYADVNRGLLYVGKFSAACEFLKYRRDWPEHIFMGDDCVHEALASHIPDGCTSVHVYGFQPISRLERGAELLSHYRREKENEPKIYVAETYAAVEIATALFHEIENYPSKQLTSLLADIEWHTILGSIQFIGNESGIAQFTLWETTRDGLTPLRTVAASKRRI